MIFFLNLLVLVISLSACQKGSNEVPLSALELRGKTIYLSTCIACHNVNPRIAGSIGPDIANSSLELITARVMRTEYPPNYKPKRQSKLMVPFPQFEKDIPAIHAYLNSFKK